MSGVNKAIILGRLGKDPEIRYMPNGNAVVGFSMATSEKWKDKDSGQMQEKTEWHNITAFGKLAEIINQYLVKGSECYIEGRLQTDKWTDKEGHDRYTTKIIADKLNMIGGKTDNQSTMAQDTQQQQQPVQQTQPRPQTGHAQQQNNQQQSGQQPQPRPLAQQNPGQIDKSGFDDSIPF